MTAWARVEVEGRILVGTVDAQLLRVHAGDMFADSTPTAETVRLESAQWLSPCIPSKVLAVWNNFHAAATKNGWSIPLEPLYFAKTANGFNAHERPIPVPSSYKGRVVFEGELGAVIGRTAKSVTLDKALDHVFGYTCVNDVTAVDILHSDPSFEQWTRAKNFDGFAVFGPTIVTGIADPSVLTVRSLVDGRERQNYSVSDMIFSPAELVSRISRDMTLLPGDVICCGTSLGVSPMRQGQRVEIVIDGVGTLSNPFGKDEPT